MNFFESKSFSSNTFQNVFNSVDFIDYNFQDFNEVISKKQFNSNEDNQQDLIYFQSVITNDNNVDKMDILEINKEKDEESNINEKINSERFFINKKRKKKIFNIKKDKYHTTMKKENKRGRKNISDKTEHPHNNNSLDNMVNKIKIYSLNHYLRDLINQNFKDKAKKILKLDHESIKCLKQNTNLELFNKTLKDIFFQSNISTKYKHNNL